jgi:hypothetical protein
MPYGAPVLPENVYYELTPRIVPAGRDSVVTVRPLYDHCRFDEDAEYVVTHVPAEQLGGRESDTETLRPEGGVLRIRRRFPAEQEHVLLVDRHAEESGEHSAEFRLYSVEDDLLARRPYKGDLHLHSDRSDGHESPGYVAGACRRIGLDFMAVTDHGRYAPSVEAQQAYEGVDVDLRIYRGEEAHPPENPVHIVNFGGGASLSELFAREPERYRAEVAAVQERIGALPPGVDPYCYASSAWCFERIREWGGLGVFCHPYWFTRNRYDVPSALSDHILAEQPFDAYEVIGGFHRPQVESNTLQVARYHEARAAGGRIPVVGVSDSHGCETGALFGWYYTIVFAPSPDLADVVESVKELYSVAVEALPEGPARAYGPFRLVKFALFLLREVMPQHDELCREEGRLMLAHLAGSPDAADLLGRLGGRTAALWDRYWGAA